MRQVAPDARVLAIRVMHSDDVANEGDIICALGQLAARIALAEEGDLAGMVDVVSLSFGYFSESSTTVTSGLWTAIEALLSLASWSWPRRRTRHEARVLPGGVRLHPVPPGQVPVISVGALNPNGPRRCSSNDGPGSGLAQGPAWSAPIRRRRRPPRSGAQGPGQPEASGGPATRTRSAGS